VGSNNQEEGEEENKMEKRDLQYIKKQVKFADIVR
jgi:hypothetical protein